MSTTTTSTSSLLNSEQILKLTFGNDEHDLVRRIKSSNILLIGAGGIGCEVLKGLILTGFPRITIIDLDTIDVSNLNRQFLYNKTHVGKSKAVVAAEIAIEKFSHHNPSTGSSLSKIIPIHDSILNLKYDKQFYQQFTFVINALDNNATRVHVNRLCLAANRPLIESGSAGYFGNVTLIKGGVTKCFECIPPKRDENTYASCTIRNTPSLPIHCIVWAKHLFAQLFGQSDEDISPDATVLTNDNNNDNESINSNNHNNQQSTSNINQTTRQYVESIDYNPKYLFDKIFYHDINYLKKIKNLWENRKNRHEPQVLSYDQIINGEIGFNDDQQLNKETTNGNGGQTSSSKIIADQRLWTINECLDIFIESLSKLNDRLKQDGCLEWDKDDDIAVDFVTAVSNFRCYCFYIARKSKFEVKSLAGNIIPAISTTNAIVGGGYVLLESIRLLQSLLPKRIFQTEENDWKPSDLELAEESNRIMENGFSVFISNKNQTNLSKIAIEKLLPPISNCLACSGQVKEIIVELPFNKITLADLIEQLVMKKFKTVAPDINCYDLKKMIFAADDEDDLKEPDSFYHTKTLESLEYFYDNICLNIKDLEQDFEVNLRLKNIQFTIDDEEQLNGDLFRILMDENELNKIHYEQQQQQNKKIRLSDEQNGQNDDIETIIDDNNDEMNRISKLKRKTIESSSSSSSIEGQQKMAAIDLIDD
uniref:SUMO-activating enzyme subunit uba-2-like n=1 Tax=Dermatophagoides pteronyssinus TaxID=6956 RepID=A0A6P6XVF9_DERPT